jgi:hypothetical protein
MPSLYFVVQYISYSVEVAVDEFSQTDFSFDRGHHKHIIVFGRYKMKCFYVENFQSLLCGERGPQ